jgi:pilus assembly protein CpaC
MSSAVPSPTADVKADRKAPGPAHAPGRLARLLLASLVAVAPAGPLQARTHHAAAADVAPEGEARHISMGVGKSTIVDLPEDAAEIFVANPGVANAVVRTARKIYIIGVAAGQTSLFALDKSGREIGSYEINIGRDIGELSQIIQAAMPTTHIVVRTVGDAIILTGEVTSAEEAQRAADMAQGFAKQNSAGNGVNTGGLVINSLTIRGRDQVMLKVTISEMRRDIAKQLGITSAGWGTITNGTLTSGLSQVNAFGINGSLASSSTAVSSVSGLLLNPSSSLQATLEAFERTGVSRTLAEPTVSAISGESAHFTVGGQFPYSSGLVCGSTGTGSTTTSSTTSSCTAGAAFKNYGITLNFEPVVLSEGRILLHLATEVADIDYTHAVNIDGVSTPGLITRQNDTTIELPSGGSIATAGLIQQTSTQVINGLPGLLSVPILGALFRSRDYQRQETELIVIVTPLIVKPVAATALARPDDGFTDASDPQGWLLGRMNKLYATPSNPEAARNYRGQVGFIQD